MKGGGVRARVKSGGSRHVRDSVSRMPTLVFSVALFAVGLLASVSLGGRQFVLLKYYDRLEAMEGDVISLQNEIEALKMNKEELAENPFWTEKLARERMNYSMSGELIFRFEGSSGMP